MRRRALAFTAPLVITLSAGCDRGSDTKSARSPTPPPAVDAAVATRSPDAAPVVKVSQVTGHVYKDGTDCFWQTDVVCDPGEKCNPPAPEKIPCPDPAVEATLAAAPTDVSGGMYVKPDGSCWFRETADCPPEVDCNPPPPIRIKCPTR
jgi:hypothetical protein